MARQSDIHALRKSLLLRIGLVMGAITALAFSSMMISAWIGRTVQGEAAAINIAGSLRMQSYRIAVNIVNPAEVDPAQHWRVLRHLSDGFARRLSDSRLTSMLPADPEHPVRRAFEAVARQWTQDIKPLLDVYITGITPSAAELERPAASGAPRDETGPDRSAISAGAVANLKVRYLLAAPRFVNTIDAFVGTLEQDAETKIWHLRLFHWIALAITVAVVLLAMVFVHRRVLRPLRELLVCAERAGQGDFSTRTRYVGGDELGRLGEAFNAMAGALSKLYRDLEGQVRAKTADLEQSNRSLEFLYRTVKRLNEAPLPDTTYDAVLRDIETVADVRASAVCLRDDGGERAHMLASRGPTGEQDCICGQTDCVKCFGEGTTHVVRLEGAGGAARDLTSFPIADSRNRHGVLLVEPRDGVQLAAWQTRLLETAASHIAIALTMSKRHAEQRRLSLLEERSAIARELHDSIAQSLSFSKIQVSRLEAELARLQGADEARSVGRALREGLTRAYRELRELLTTFRLRMNERDLATALNDAVREFAEKGETEITFVNDLHHHSLGPNEEIHLLHIAREALSNITRHAKARHATVAIASTERGEVTLSVEDDGIGIPANGASRRADHYGLAIMRERAHSLGSTLHVTSRPGGGSRISLSFLPVALRVARSSERGAGEPIPPVLADDAPAMTGAGAEASAAPAVQPAEVARS